MSPINSWTEEKEYWRNLEELARTPEYEELVRREFPEGADTPPHDFSRRRFLQLMGASIALAGFSGCKWPREEIVPFALRPDGIAPGITRRFATTFEMGHSSTGVLVTSYDGRPVKVEGNPAHPASGGATDLFAQASVLELYDPDRSRKPATKKGGKATWEQFTTEWQPKTAALWERGGEGLAVLSERSSSPSLDAMKDRLLNSFPNAKWYEYEAISWDERREGTRIAFGTPHDVHLDCSKARVILSLDDDLFGGNPAALKNSREIMAQRDPDTSEMNRLYIVESTLTTTGISADHRLGVAASKVGVFATALLSELIERHGVEAPDNFGVYRASHNDRSQKLIAALADDLAHHKGSSVITAGQSQPAWVHTLTCFLNQALGNVGNTVHYTADHDPARLSHGEAIRELTGAMGAGEVQMLVMLGGNPAHDAPADLDFGAALAKVPESTHLSLYKNETSLLSTWHLPRAHYLEAWGDARAEDGTWSMVQPLIEPLYHGKTPIELLALLLGEGERSGYEIVRRTMRESLDTGLDFEKFWRRAIHDGVVAKTIDPLTKASFQQDVSPMNIDPRGITRALRSGPAYAEPTRREDGIEVILHPSQTLFDGRFANSSWLQEIPVQSTKLTWDNAAVLSPATAAEIGVTSGDNVRVSHDNREITLPAFVVPGQPTGTVAIALGYGRTAAGHVGSGVGVNAYALRTTAHPSSLTGAKIEKASGRKKLATTQTQYMIDDIGMKGRGKRLSAIVREGEFETYKHDPDHALPHDHHPPLISLWKELSFSGHAWGMATDLGKCTGCSACVVACQAENNIPVVGLDEVARGRGMHWLRIDRYFSGDPESPQIINQPLTCQQCENAPCEQVCPVGATQHSEEGLNDMTYNRCIGTRYCANNCPYKVRRFNFFNNQKDMKEIEKMVYNPEVTPRARGVMEKCTFCVQRIQNGKIRAKNAGREVGDGEITPACAQVCPTGAITFGDLADKESRVSRKHELHRAYYLLEELNVKPRNAFLARIRNSNPALVKAQKESHGDQHG